MLSYSETLTWERKNGYKISLAGTLLVVFVIDFEYYWKDFAEKFIFVGKTQTDRALTYFELALVI